MNKPTATYTPPPDPVGGIVTLTLDVNKANELRALLGKCNGNVFNQVHNALDTVLCAVPSLPVLCIEFYNERSPGISNTTIDFHGSLKFVKERY